MFRKVGARGRGLINNVKKNKFHSLYVSELKPNLNLRSVLAQVPNGGIADTSNKASFFNVNKNIGRPLPKVPYNDKREIDNKLSKNPDNGNAYGYPGAFGYTCQEREIISRLRLVSPLDLASNKSKKSSVDFEDKNIKRYSPENSEAIYALSRKNSMLSKLEPSGFKVDDLLLTTQNTIDKVEKVTKFDPYAVI